ncbi:MAG: Lrp/AsnC ligand binding domain-containing protein [Proteobacteria bacterium]|nr:Lrp/AsnC ligand binding domain-containing protein [Pseudomonadota bacterium]
MKPIFIQLQCAPGKTYEVADAVYKTELVSELYSTSGEYDLLMKIYLTEEQDAGKFINENIANIPGIVRTLTTMTFTAF